MEGDNQAGFTGHGQKLAQKPVEERRHRDVEADYSVWTFHRVTYSRSDNKIGLHFGLILASHDGSVPTVPIGLITVCFFLLLLAYF